MIDNAPTVMNPNEDTDMADDYIRGKMDIAEHRTTFNSVIAASVYSALVLSVVILHLTLVFGGDFPWMNALLISILTGGVAGFFMKQGAVYWVTLAVLGLTGLIAGGLANLLG